MRFYLKRYIQWYIVRAIVLFLGEISFPLCDTSFQLCDISFPLHDNRFRFAIYRFSLKRYRSSLSSQHCELIHVHFPKIIYDNDESSSLRSQLFEMASGELNAFNVNWKHYWTYLPWFHEKNPLYNAWNPITILFRSKEDNCVTVEE